LTQQFGFVALPFTCVLMRGIWAFTTNYVSGVVGLTFVFLLGFVLAMIAKITLRFVLLFCSSLDLSESYNYESLQSLSSKVCEIQDKETSAVRSTESD